MSTSKRRRGAPETGPSDRRGAVADAAKALSSATAELKRALTAEFDAAGTEISASIASSLQEVSKSLDEMATKVGSSGKAARTRQELLDAAARVFADRGYEGASVGDIAEAAGFTKGALYAHFGSKEQLFVELSHGFADEAVAATEAVDTGDQGFIDWFATQSRAELAGDVDTAPIVLGIEFALFGLRHPAHREAMADIDQRYTIAIARRLAGDRIGHRLAASELPDRGDMVRALGFLAVSNQLLIKHRLGVEQADADALTELLQLLS